MPPLPALTAVPFAEAIAWARARQVVLPESYYGQLQGLARSMAFSIAGIAKLDQLQTVLDSLAANLESGESFGQWKNRVREGEIPLDLPRHRVECLPGENLVSGAVIRAGHRRWYQGRIVEVVTNNGRKFTATPNHPMLTRRGWVAAGELNNGDDLIGYRRDQDSRARSNSHKHERPSAISEVFVALSESAVTERIEGSRLDFHGDGSDCDVDIIRTTRDLHFGDFAAIRKPFGDLRFSKPDLSALTFCPSCHHLIVVSQRCGFCDRPYADTGRSQFLMDEIVAGAIGQGEGVGAFSGRVSRNQIIDGHVIAEFGREPAISEIQASCDAARPAYAGLPDNSADPPDGNANGCGDFLDALPRDIEFDRVVSLKVLDFHGYVYNLSTAHGYYLLDGLYTGNTIFRTNIQGHYGRGRCEQQQRTVDDRPWLLYDAVNDSRVRPTHAAMDGFVARYDDPIWKVWRSPAGYQCRCRQISLSDSQAKRFIEADAKRLAADHELAQARASAQPDKGWDYDPCAEPDEGLRRAWERWVGKAHPLLAEIAQAMDAQLQAAMAAFEAARQDCLAFGKANNRERLILLDEKSGKELTRDDGNVNSVKFTPTMLSLLDDEKQLIRLIHNHPSDNPLSKADYLTLSRPGVSGIEAAGHAGSRYSAMVGPNGRLDAQKFKEVMDAIDEAIYTEMRPLATSENLKFLQWAHYHFFALALDELGIIRYSPILTAEKVEALTKFKSLADRGIAAAKRGAQGAL